ncbi:MAG TPA: 3'-5' exonuclease, partial [Lachnospiraceae bacterium]
IDNGQDDVAVRRIINVPRRGIGATTIGRVADYAVDRELSFYESCRLAKEVPGMGKAALKVLPFVDFIEKFREKKESLPVSDLIIEIMKETGYQEELEREDTEEARERLENIDELLNKAVVYQQTAEAPSLSGFLEEVALIADIDSLEESDNKVLLMTLHSAKGLEFPYVYLAGMEDGMFPSHQTLFSDDKSDLEEERRLCYVGITRAQKELTLTSAQQRMVHGETQYSKVSMFVREIPRELVDLGREIPEKKTEKIPMTGDFMRMKESFRAKVFEPEKYKVVKAESLDYQVGDRIRHVKFGEGSVENIVDGGKDFEVTVNFDRVGVKKMFAAFAKLKKI